MSPAVHLSEAYRWAIRRLPFRLTDRDAAADGDASDDTQASPFDRADTGRADRSRLDALRHGRPRLWPHVPVRRSERSATGLREPWHRTIDWPLLLFWVLYLALFFGAAWLIFG